MQSNAIPAGRLIPVDATRRIFFSAVSTAIFLILPSNSTAQSEIKISGRVIDEISGAPIPGVVIDLGIAGKNIVSDGLGRFHFSDIPRGEYAISAARIGYRQAVPVKVIVGGAFTIPVTIYLTPVAIVVGGQTVMANRNSRNVISRGPGVTIIEIPETGMKSLAGLIEQVPELELVESGPRKYLRIRGAGLNATTIMLDGRIVNSTLDSRGDISSIPLSSVVKVEIFTGGFGAPGLAGSVNFITDIRRKNDFSIGLVRGSFAKESYSIKTESSPAGNFGVLFDGRSEFCRGNFVFIDPRDSVQTRQNNHDRTARLFGAATYKRPFGSIKFSGAYFRRTAGIPGPIFQLTPAAESKTEEFELYSKFERKAGDIPAFEISSGFTKRSADYDSPRTPTNFIPYRTRFDEEARDIKLRLGSSGQIDFDSYISSRYESLTGEDLLRPEASFGFHSRTIHTIAASAAYRFPVSFLRVDSSSVTLGVREEWGARGNFVSPSAGLRVNLDLPFDPGFDFSYSRGRRLPDLADLYWKEDVFATPNPDLNPERSECFQAGAGIRGRLAGPFNIRVSRFLDRYHDLIIWRKWAGDKYKPVNLSKARIDGWESTFETNPLTGPLTAFWTLNSLRPLNREDEINHHDKYLTFRPLGTQTVGIDFNLDLFALRLRGRHIGRRFTTEENTKSLPPVDLADLELEYGLRIKMIKAVVGFAITNIGDIQYEILDRQPEKPREYKIKFELSQKGERL